MQAIVFAMVMPLWLMMTVLAPNSSSIIASMMT
jgi:hypothetical protein